MVKEGILEALGIDKRSEWYNSFMAVPKPKQEEVRICTDQAKLNWAKYVPCTETGGD